MYDAAFRFDTAAPQRATGELAVSLRARDGGTALAGLRQAGCLRARFPRGGTPGWADVVTLNISGGVAGGDRLDSRFAVQTGARASFTAQAAERYYRALPDGEPAHVRTSIDVAAGGSAEWLPQETILFDRSALDRRLDVELAADAWFLGLEWLVFGRAALGETVAFGSLRDTFAIRRAGRLVLYDAIRLDGAIAATLCGRATAGCARAVAVLVHVAPDAESHIDALRAVLPAEAGASAWNGMLVARMITADTAALRSSVVAALAVLRGPRKLPRVWWC